MELPTRVLKAAALCAAKKDLRQQLNGVLIDIINKDNIVIVATNGHILFAAKQKSLTRGDYVLGEDKRIIVPLGAIDASLIGHKNNYITLIKTDSGYLLGGVNFTPIRQNLPNYRRAIFDPSLRVKEKGKAGNFNVDYLKIGTLAMKLVGNKNACLQQYGTELAAAMIGRDTRYIFIVMPTRIDYEYKEAF